MKHDWEKRYFEIEKNNWWFLGRRDLVGGFLKGLKNKKILEIGCSTGYNIKELSNKFAPGNRFMGLDNSEYFVKNKVFDNVILGDANKLSFKENSFDYILCLDVIEHIEDDVKVMKEIHKILKPNGKFIITVPALQILYGPHDFLNKHYRRYSKSLLKERLFNAGFKSVQISYWIFILFLPVFIIKFTKKFFKATENSADVLEPPAFGNSFLLRLLKFENFLIKHNINLPIGISLFAVASKD